MTPTKLLEINTMSVFYSRYGAAEKLALAAGVGAVQARANIRMRRLRDLADASEIAQDQSWSENLERMTPEYIAPREIDSTWADVILLSTPFEEVPEETALREIIAYLGSLKDIHGDMHGKIAAIVNPRVATCAPLYSAAALAGFTVIPAPADALDATAFGKRVCEMARAIKQATQAK